MTAFRATVVYPLINNENSWPVVEWKEDEDTEVIAIFHIQNEPDGVDACSWLMHSANGVHTEENATSRWKRSSIEWSVRQLGHLKTLFGAAQHVMGILEWSVADALPLYCQSRPENCSDGQYGLLK